MLSRTKRHFDLSGRLYSIFRHRKCHRSTGMYRRLSQTHAMRCRSVMDMDIEIESNLFPSRTALTVVGWITLDGSDHRGCCTQWGVPRRCLDWCRGEAVSSVELCALTYTKPIISCFHEGKGEAEKLFPFCRDQFIERSVNFFFMWFRTNSWTASQCSNRTGKGQLD